MKYKCALIKLLPLILLAACGNEKKKPEQKTEKQAYKLVAVKQGQVGSEAHLPGTLQPFEFVQLFPKVNGFVKQVYVDRGSAVHKGQVLIILEAPEIAENVSAAKLKYTQAQAMYLTSKDRYNRLLTTSQTPGTVAAYDLAAAKSKMEADDANMQSTYAGYKAQQDLASYLTVAAPFDGIITERDVHPGALVGSGAEGSKPMLVLQQQSKLRLVINVPEQYSVQIKEGDIIHFTISSLPGQQFTGKVARTSGSLNNYRAETVEADVDNSSRTFQPGMYAEVVLPVSGSANAFSVPASAIVTTTEHKYVVAVRSSHALLIDVTTGNQQGDTTEVFGSLQPNEKIVANATYQIKDGQEIH